MLFLPFEAVVYRDLEETLPEPDDVSREKIRVVGVRNLHLEPVRGVDIGDGEPAQAVEGSLTQPPLHGAFAVEAAPQQPRAGSAHLLQGAVADVAAPCILQAGQELVTAPRDGLVDEEPQLPVVEQHDLVPGF